MILRILIEVNFNMAYITTGLITSLIIFIGILQGNVSRTIPEDAVNIINDYECLTDNDCTGKNTYCDLNLKLCSQCVNCSIYFRTTKKDVKCPKDISDCGICFDGYLEEIFFGGEIRDICVPMESNIESNTLPIPAKISSNSYWEHYGTIFIIINVSLFSLLWTYFYKKIANSNNISNALQDNTEHQLPSYDSCMKLDNYVTDDVQEFHLFTGEQPPRNEWRHQNAVPFRLQNDFQEPLDHHYIIDQNENIEEVDGIMREVEDPELHDEETMQSVWIPRPRTPSPEPLPVEIVDFQNDVEICQPPSKRIKLDEQSTEEKNDEDEDSSSDMSQD